MSFLCTCYALALGARFSLRSKEIVISFFRCKSEKRCTSARCISNFDLIPVTTFEHCVGYRGDRKFFASLLYELTYKHVVSNESAALNGQGKLCKNFFKSFRVLWLNASDWPIRSAGLWPLCHSHQFSCFNGSCTSDSPHSIGDALLVPLRKLFLVFSSFSTFNIRLSRFRDGSRLVRLSRLRISNKKFLVEPLYPTPKIPPTSKLEALNCIKETWNIFTKFRTI